MAERKDLELGDVVAERESKIVGSGTHSSLMKLISPARGPWGFSADLLQAGGETSSASPKSCF